MLESQALSSLNSNFFKFSNSGFGFEDLFSYNGILTPNILRKQSNTNENNFLQNSFGSSQNININMFDLNYFNRNNNNNNNINSNSNNNNCVFPMVEMNYKISNVKSQNNNEANLLRNSGSNLETKYDQMLMESINKNKNLNDFYSNENEDKDSENLLFKEFMKRNNFDDYNFRKLNS
jgi:hypothetical protein